MRRSSLKFLVLFLLIAALVHPRARHAPPLPPLAVPAAAPDWRQGPLQRALDVKLWQESLWLLTLHAEGNVGAQRRQERAQFEARYGNGACGGDLPPCSVMICESGGSLTAQNPQSTASGKWQILDSTWAGYGGYARASDAPEDVQDARAREIYADGAGRRAWVC